MMGHNKRREYRLILLANRPLCTYCDCRLTPADSTLDHVIPQSHGGTHTKNNLVLCCLKCNHEKGDLTWTDWLKKSNKSKRWARRLRSELAKLGNDIVDDGQPGNYFWDFLYEIPYLCHVFRISSIFYVGSIVCLGMATFGTGSKQALPLGILLLALAGFANSVAVSKRSCNCK